MDFNLKNNIDKVSAQARLRGKPAKEKELTASDTPELGASTPTDALALQGAVEGPSTSSRQLAQEFADKYKRLQAVAMDPAAYDDLADTLGTPSYVLVDTVVRLCRDTQAESFDERLKTLRVIQHVCPLPDEMRDMIEDDLKRTSKAA